MKGKREGQKLKISAALLLLFLGDIFLNSYSSATYRTPSQLLLKSTVSENAKFYGISRRIINSIIKNAKETNLDPYLITCLIEIESSFRTNAISVKGAVGLMQVKPSVANAIADEIIKDRAFDLLKPEDNITFGTYYLSKLVERFGDLETALLAYNLGPTRVTQSMNTKEKLPKRYIQKIKGCYKKFMYNQ